MIPRWHPANIERKLDNDGKNIEAKIERTLAKDIKNTEAALKENVSREALHCVVGRPAAVPAAISR